MLNIINPSLPAATSLTHSKQPAPPSPHPYYHLHFFIMKPTHTLLRKNPPDPALSPPPRATPCLARSSQAGSTTLGPSILMPPVLSMHPDSIHHICNPPWSPSCPYKGSKPKKRKGRKGEKNTAATMQNSAGQSSAYCPQACLSSPGLSPKHTLFSQETTAPQLGGWNSGCVAI